MLTETDYFLGSDRYLREIRQAVGTPLLRKDFTLDDYMVCQAKTLGADAILLIAAILSDSQLQEYRLLAESLGMDAWWKPMMKRKWNGPSGAAPGSSE